MMNTMKSARKEPEPLPKGKTMPTVTVEHYGVTASGRTVTEAKRAAGELIRERLAGDYNPYLVEYRGYVSLVYRTPSDGWVSRLISDGADGLRTGTIYGGSGVSDRAEAIRKAQVHVAQLGWQAADGLTVPDFIRDESDRRDLESHYRFFQRHASAKARGLSDCDAHAYATRDPRRADLWAGEAG